MTMAATVKELPSGTRDHTLAGHLRLPRAGRVPHAGLVDTPQLTDIKEQATGSYVPVFAARRYPTPALVIAAALAITGSGLLPASDDTVVPPRLPKPCLGVPRQEPLNPTSLKRRITQ